MQKYFINWKMRVMFYSSIDFHETLEKNKITDFLIDLLKKIMLKIVISRCLC